MGKPAARLGDSTAHGTPLGGTGFGSPTVFIGGQPAWRGIPLAGVAGLQSAKTSTDTAIKIAEQTTNVANFPPAKAAALAAEQTLKASTLVSMSSMIIGLGAMADISFCPIPSPVPPHGPGVVMDGSTTVLINNMPAARLGNTITEALGPPNKIVSGCMSVLIGG